jgi:hypothetical protein
MKNHTWHPNVWHELQLHGVGNLMKWPYRLYIYWNETLYTHTHTQWVWKKVTNFWCKWRRQDQQYQDPWSNIEHT